VQPIWEVMTQILFYASPFIYTVARYPASVVHLAMINPIGAIMTQLNHAFIDPRAPTAAQVIGGPVRLVLPVGIIVAMAVLGAWLFTREAPRIAENL
jgi:ABC-2 type transport system permease protein